MALWAVPFTLLAVHRDVLERRIPNWLTFPALALAVGLAVWKTGFAGATASLLGAGLAFAFLVIPYAAGVMGAGDVKATMAVGALLGVAGITGCIAWALLAGGVAGVVWITVHGELGDVGRRWGRALALTATLRRWTYEPPQEGTAAARGLPYAVFLGLGLAAQLGFGGPWG